MLVSFVGARYTSNSPQLNRTPPMMLLTLFLMACGDEEASTKTPAASASKSKGPTLLAAAEESASSASKSDDPRAKLIKAWSKGSPEAVKDLQSMLEQRELKGQVEQRRIDAAMVQVEAALTASCGSEASKAAFTTYLDRQAASLAADRQVLTDILEKVDTEGREQLWEVEDVETALAAGRSQMARQARRGLPTWLGSAGTKEEEKLQSRRLVLSMNLAAESGSLDAEALLAEFTLLVKQVEPTGADTSAQVVASLQKVDEGLLVAQRQRFDALNANCGQIPSQLWLTMLADNHIAGFLGRLAGGAPPAGGEGQAGGKTGGGVQGSTVGAQGGATGGIASSMQGGGMAGMSGQSGGMGGQGGGMGGQGGGQGGQGGGKAGGPQGGGGR
jgi:hypothetical protein